ncbi:hypothetical protein GCM10023152_08050 [Agromyces bauzanensis]|uniref:5-hmdU DNA kinase helical domain-containing protein n=2 Tax=Agromyces bauzanensis TaxID=1308924 RepID=A0A917UVB6_9MICO|nr:hypothetical protein GCM10011372_27370 [Agromyces bauzanensis]
MRHIRIGNADVQASDVLASYWFFAAERQRVYHRRLAGTPSPWTVDPILTKFRFTNAYRAADRVSQDLIRVAYAGSQSRDDLVLRVLLYRFFNRPSTWGALEAAVGEIGVDTFDVESYDRVLSGLLADGHRVYSAAYIVPPPPFGAERKHRNHLLLIQHMLRSGVVEKLGTADSLQQVYEVIASYPSLGPFLSYQLAIDLNYTTLLDFEEDDFVVPGPGARSGIAKCFPGLGTVPAEDVIRWMVDHQEEEFERHDLVFEDLFGRRLTLIDCQNLFCETDKYARVAHPDARGVGGRTRIKQQFTPQGSPAAPYFPPKWGINERAGALRGDLVSA